MYIAPFAVEEWMNAYETRAAHNIAETCVDSVSLDELFALTGEDKAAFFGEFCARRMTYGDIEGAPAFREGICRLYRTIRPGEIIPTHGAAGANHHVFTSLVSPGDVVISVMPTYQQLYSIPESFGAQVKILPLRREDGYLPDLEKLRRMAAGGARMICINNPNNPTGALMDEAMLAQIVDIAREAGAYLLCDEVYRHLTQKDAYSPSIADMYERGISVSSMSKVFSLAGLRLGWIATHDEAARRAMLSRRDYNLISCGMFDEAVAAIALRHADKLLERSRGIVRENLAILSDWVEREPHVRFVRPKAGTTALIHYDLPVDSFAFCRGLLSSTGALVTPGDCFGEAGCFRIGYACERDELERGLAAVSGYLREKEAGV